MSLILALACAWNVELMSTEEIQEIKERTRNQVPEFLVQSMCLFISILALACAWNVELMSTEEIQEIKERITK